MNDIKNENQTNVRVTRPLLSRKMNYILMGLGILLLLIGFFCLSGGGDVPDEAFDGDIFNTRRTVVAPILLLLGLVAEIVAIMLFLQHDKQEKTDDSFAKTTKADNAENVRTLQENRLHHDEFVQKSQIELEQMRPADLFRYRCKEAIIQVMKPYRQSNNTGFQSVACKKLLSLANQMSNSTELMETAIVFGYGGDFSNIIYEEIDKALQTYCNISIYDVWDYNEKYKEFQLDSSLGLYINSNRLKQALERAVTEQRDSAKQQ